jgi:hypothetical protein
MPLPVFSIPPDQSSYAFQYGHNAVATKLDGGASRVRADMLNGAHTVTCQWSLTKKGYEYFMAFYRQAISRGSLPFTISLMLDDGNMVALTAIFLPDTLNLTTQQGQRWVVSATLEVTPDPTLNDTADAATVAAYVSGT